ncbi:alpha-glucan family phosphorylase [Mucilaginibacter boryungensis]|uniref:Alpha-glucan family phosphorylase n=1 Tax=Mucilaginibacter boryungensis TaxID=768480 RepID=A0ABR9XF39_9SPHI|nr:alpha-glucan family phosphorylase [Mucilaginibacter boryungensis]MBE9665695.1 alpha-glucan family phosphorylase [Mucilaginibacter boryungensis]
MDRAEVFGYIPDGKYKTSVAYFSMEFAIDQALKTYAGGLGFLAGSHLRSAFEMKQNLVGIGILWKYGYYDQVRNGTNHMACAFIEKDYSFLTNTGIIFTVTVHNAPVHVKAYLLKPEVFGCAPVFLLSTDIPENDYLSQTITHRLYDPNESTRIAQNIVLGIGGAMLLDILGLTPDVYHMNEGHSVAPNFYLYDKFKNLAEIKKRVVFTTHTPEMAGNEAHSFDLLQEMSFFYHLRTAEVKALLNIDGDNFNYTLTALKFARKANAVSQMHGRVARQMWAGNTGVCEIIAITNAQNPRYWMDAEISQAIADGQSEHLVLRKKELKRALFKVVADQCGKLFREDVLTIVWARRFAGYKRADLLMYDWPGFLNLVNNPDYPVQIIWAGKPYPEDDGAIALFNQIINRTAALPNCAVLTGYELQLSAMLKQGADVWLNNPRMYHEASGTSGMTAAMNGAVNLTIPDGWVPEFARNAENCFLITPASDEFSVMEKDKLENKALLEILNHHVLPMYYERQSDWITIVRSAFSDIMPAFGSDRLACQYYNDLYN